MPNLNISNVSKETTHEIVRLVANSSAQVTIQIRGEYETWSPTQATMYMHSLPTGSCQFVVSLISANGRILAEDLRDQGRSLRGLTSPLTRTLNKLTASGLLPLGLPHPVELEYDVVQASYRRTNAVIMRSELIPSFTQAVKRLLLTPDL